jgi:2-oxoglutarate dehydrogenase E2 component (dihydrolipoamide succinyltransferase)
MLLEMKVPSPGESISEVEIATWLVENGDYVEKDQEIAEVDSDKATLALPAEVSGTIKIVVEEGDTVAVGDIVCIIDTDGVGQAKAQPQAATATAQQSAPVSNSNVDAKATPLAKAIIQQNDLSPKDVTGTGEGGKILKEDVIEAMSSSKTDGPRGMERKKMSMLRRKVAQRLVSVKNETAMLTTFNEVDMTAINDIRKKYKEEFKEKYGVGLGFMSFFTKSITKALMEFPDVNAMIDGKEVIHHNYADISIAVSAPKGLMVPVIRNAELMNFEQVESEVKRLAIKARDGKITLEEMIGGTFTITNGGVFGSMLSTPIINPPQSAILGMHNIVQRPMAVDGKVEIRPIMYLALSYDHRIIDGRESVGFLCRVKECLEDPTTHLLAGNVKKSLGL